MTFHSPSEAPVRYYRLTVARGHLGTGRTEFATLYVRTALQPADLMFNCGKPVAGIKRVAEVAAVSEAAFLAAVRGGEHCFIAVTRRAWATADSAARDAGKLRRARRYHLNRQRARQEQERER